MSGVSSSNSHTRWSHNKFRTTKHHQNQTACIFCANTFGMGVRSSKSNHIVPPIREIFCAFNASSFLKLFRIHLFVSVRACNGVEIQPPPKNSLNFYPYFHYTQLKYFSINGIIMKNSAPIYVCAAPAKSDFFSSSFLFFWTFFLFLLLLVVNIFQNSILCGKFVNLHNIHVDTDWMVLSLLLLVHSGISAFILS